MPIMRHGFVHQPANSQPTLPLTFYSATTVHDNKCMLVSNGLASQKEQKVFTSIYSGHIYKKEGTTVLKKGFSYGRLYATCYLHKNL